MSKSAEYDLLFGNIEKYILWCDRIEIENKDISYLPAEKDIEILSLLKQLIDFVNILVEHLFIFNKFHVLKETEMERS